VDAIILVYNDLTDAEKKKVDKYLEDRRKRLARENAEFEAKLAVEVEKSRRKAPTERVIACLLGKVFYEDYRNFVNLVEEPLKWLICGKCKANCALAGRCG
jgi:hypothetical protein